MVGYKNPEGTSNPFYYKDAVDLWKKIEEEREPYLIRCQIMGPPYGSLMKRLYER